jgi:hypothetical protein
LANNSVANTPILQPSIISTLKTAQAATALREAAE